jgi:hypothetical protein
LLKNQKPETRNQKPETRNQKPEARSQKPEAEISTASLHERKTISARSAGEPSGFWLLASGFWLLVSGF